MESVEKACGCILLVEDNADSQAVYRLILQHFGYRVITAENGAEAVRLTLEHLPDLVLMDVSIPVMNGWEATRRLKADSRTREIPIVALTAHALESDRKMAQEVGCDGYLAKPVEPRRVVQEVESQLSRRSGRGPSPS